MSYDELRKEKYDELRKKLDLVYAEADEIERAMNTESGMLSSDPRVSRLRDLWEKADALENAIFDAER